MIGTMPISVGARAVSAADILASRVRADTAATTVGVRVTSLLMQAARDLQDLRRRLAARRAAAQLAIFTPTPGRRPV